MKISVIIPTYNEEANIAGLVTTLNKNGGQSIEEIIVVDGGSSDETIKKAYQAGAKVLDSPVKCRACQLNLGAKESKGDILYFVHADTRPPESFVSDIVEHVSKGFVAGCYRFRFDSSKFLLKINAYCTRFRGLMFRGGDQSLFVTKEVFEGLGGFDEDYRVMEEYDFIKRLGRKYSFKVIPKVIMVSARKYEHNGWLRVNLANFVAFSMYRWGCSQERIINTYFRMLKQENYNPEA